MARPVLSGDGTASVTAVLFAGGELVAQVTELGIPTDAGFEELDLPGLRTTVRGPENADVLVREIRHR